jgi:hypothetical protein
MTYEVVKTYVVSAESDEKAKEIITRLEEKNLQLLFLKSETFTVVKPEEHTGIWPKLW